MARMSNRDRIAHAAAEARARKAEKLAKKEAKGPPKEKAPKRPPKPRVKEVRMKVVWAVCNASGRAVKTFPYPDKDAAASEAQNLTDSTGYAHELRATKVPMD